MAIIVEDSEFENSEEFLLVLKDILEELQRREIFVKENGELDEDDEIILIRIGDFDNLGKGLTKEQGLEFLEIYSHIYSSGANFRIQCQTREL